MADTEVVKEDDSPTPAAPDEGAPLSTAAEDAKQGKTGHTRGATTTDLTGELDDEGVSDSALTAVLIAYFSVFLDTMGISIVQPILPFYAEKFNANATQLGAVYSVFALASMFANYAMGTLSDKYGRRLAILYSLFGTAVTYIIQGLAWDYWSLLGFRVLCGAFGGSIPIANAVVTDIIPRSEQPKYFGFIGATVAGAFIVGPGMGSGLSEFGLRIPFFVSGALGTIGFLFAYTALRETNPATLAKQRKKDDDAEQVPSGKPRSPSTSASDANATDAQSSEPDKSSNIPNEAYFVAFLCFCWQFSFSAYQAMIGFYYADKFGFKSLQLGFAVVVLASFFTFTSLFIFGPLSKKLGLWLSGLIGYISTTLGMGLIPVTDEVWFVLTVTTVFIGMGNGVILPAMNGAGAMFANSKNRGKVLAFINASTQFGGVIGPLVHGVVYSVGKGLPFYVACATLAVCVVSIAMFLNMNPDLRSVKTQPRIVYGIGVEAPRWEVFKADQPTKKDLEKLGTWFGGMLTDRNYRWVSHYPKLQQLLKRVFPPLETSSFDEYAVQIQFILDGINKLDEEYQSALTSNGVCPI